jgi:ArsR family transcriptional regulator
MEQTTLFHILSDETRLRALALMHSSGEVCICELVHALELPQPKISRHMAAMRDAGVVRPRRDAQWVFYTLNPALPAWQKQVIAAAMGGLNDSPVTKTDLERLKTMNNRPARCAA